ncbi:hypothetical protein BUALT_Bualt06G0088500 [Buddleja alternifolia]|uniref:Dof zinc finger protein n=1 Tax=Buddleja alternifolia TaxID=168488 RepID=A0AAV6XLC6_9LAMI|nr:hypothetical protein BUALT_Bualt06G0088500 [Buddleja alternifolia]
MDTAQWPQGIGVINHASSVENSRPTNTEKKPRPQKEQAINCPRCSSTNTKFCYYNNYSLSQPRYFCKTCRRYWTEGGSLRNVPVGGGSRKNKRSSSSSSSSNNIIPSSSSSSSKKMIIPDHLSPPNFAPQNPKIHEGHDLNLAYNPSHYNGISEFVALPFGLDAKSLNNPPNPNSDNLPIMEFLKAGNVMGTNGMSSYMNTTDSNSVYSSSGFHLGNDHFKPSLNFSIDGLENNNSGGYIGNSLQVGGVHDQIQDHHTNSSRVLFPFEELKPNDHHHHHQFDHQQDNRGGGQGEANNGYWNGMLAGGSW